MTMTNVKGIAAESGINQVKRGTTVSPSTPDEIKRDRKAEKGGAQEDTLQVNQERRRAAGMIENARLLLEELPDSRPERIAQVKQRLQEGFYERAEVLEGTAGKILDDLQAKPPKTVSEDEADKIDQVKNRLRDGYYDRLDILEETARRILKKRP
jgi:anti-sigma28 factor (negative regulator of flagellin synthesis)